MITQFCPSLACIQGVQGLNRGISGTEGFAVCPCLAHSTMEKQGPCCCCATDSVSIFRACGLGQGKDSADDNGAHCLPSKVGNTAGFISSLSESLDQYQVSVKSNDGVDPNARGPCFKYTIHCSGLTCAV